MTDLLPATSLVYLEYDVDHGWRAVIGGGAGAGAARGPTPTRALLNLCFLLREGRWHWDEERLDPPAAIPDSPNVIVLRATGPDGWRTWTAASAGGRNPLTASDPDPANALAAFAVQMRPAGYILDADFRAERSERG